jgi:hypothetical protein
VASTGGQTQVHPVGGQVVERPEKGLARPGKIAPAPIDKASRIFAIMVKRRS